MESANQDAARPRKRRRRAYRCYAALADAGRWLSGIARRQVIVAVSNQVRETIEGGFLPALGQSWEGRPTQTVLVERDPSCQAGWRRARVLSTAGQGRPSPGDTIGFCIGPAGIRSEDETSSDEVSITDSAADAGCCYDDTTMVGPLAVADGGEDNDAESLASAASTSSGNCSSRSSWSSISAEEELSPVATHTASTESWPPPWWTSRPNPSPSTAAALLRTSRRLDASGMPVTALPVLRELFASSGRKGAEAPQHAGDDPSIGTPRWLQGVLEVCGEPGAGKTQLCLHAAAAMALQPPCAASGGPPAPGSSCPRLPSGPLRTAGIPAEVRRLITRAPTGHTAVTPEATLQHCGPCVLYLYSEAVPVARLHGLIRARLEVSGAPGGTPAAAATLDRVFFERVATPAALYTALCSQLRLLAAHAPLRLLVVDSLASVMRAEELVPATDRSLLLFRIAAVLRRIVAEWRVQVLVTNQVTADVQGTLGSNGVKPALGYAWASCVAHRVMLQRRSCSTMSGGTGSAGGGPATQRRGLSRGRAAHVDFSSVVSEATVPFEIRATGLHCLGRGDAEGVR